MTATTVDLKRKYEAGREPVFNDLPVKASTTIYQGTAVGLDSGYARPIADGDTFAGFANAQADNSAGANAAIDVKVRSQGLVEVDVTGVTGVSDVDDDVYAADDQTFSITDSGTDVLIGTIHRHVSGTKCILAFNAASLRSI